MESFSLINKEIDFLYIAVSKGDNVVNVTFPYSWLGIALLNYSCFNLYLNVPRLETTVDINVQIKASKENTIYIVL